VGTLAFGVGHACVLGAALCVADVTCVRIDPAVVRLALARQTAVASVGAALSAGTTHTAGTTVCAESPATVLASRLPTDAASSAESRRGIPRATVPILQGRCRLRSASAGMDAKAKKDQKPGARGGLCHRVPDFRAAIGPPQTEQGSYHGSRTGLRAGRA